MRISKKQVSLFFVLSSRIFAYRGEIDQRYVAQIKTMAALHSRQQWDRHEKLKSEIDQSRRDMKVLKKTLSLEGQATTILLARLVEQDGSVE